MVNRCEIQRVKTEVKITNFQPSRLVTETRWLYISIQLNTTNVWRDPGAPDAVGPDGSRKPREGRAVKPGREPAGTGRSRGWNKTENSTINR